MNPEVFIIEKIGDSYKFVIPYGYIKEINGNMLPVGTYQIQEPVTRVQNVTKRMFIENYSNGSDIMLSEGYNLMRVNLERKGYQNDDGVIIFEKIDDRHAYEKFLDEWKPMIKTEYDKTDDFFTIVDVTGRQDIPFIVPIRMLGEINNSSEALFSYTPNPETFVGIVAIEKGYLSTKVSERKEKTFEYSMGLRFLKINGEYAKYLVNENELEFKGISAGTWNECYKKYQDHLATIRNAFNIAEAKRTYKKVEASTVTFVIEELENIDYNLKKLKAVPSKKDSSVTPTAISTLVRNLIKKLSDTVLEEQKK